VRAAVGLFNFYTALTPLPAAVAATLHTLKASELRPGYWQAASRRIIGHNSAAILVNETVAAAVTPANSAI
jgi:hypothetical protein